MVIPLLHSTIKTGGNSPFNVLGTKTKTIKCLNGSPKTCRVQIIPVKKYSPGGLIRIINGLKVSKISQLNSCPPDWKIWSPRNKADWTAVYEALGHNIHNYPRKPALIIDVTRTQKGCGGCTKFAMKSGVKQQSSWRTSDGSAWWLRDTKFNEPNGDYQPNCYMSVHSVDPNNVQFNDGSCGYSSSEYLCQPRKPPPPRKGSSNPNLILILTQVSHGRSQLLALILLLMLI